jgi:hypothetical protein
MKDAIWLVDMELGICNATNLMNKLFIGMKN